MKSLKMRIEYLEIDNARLEKKIAFLEESIESKREVIAGKERLITLLEDRLARYEEPKPRLAIVRQIRPVA
ncbi:MAG: hypothetical protein J0652_01060 [Desulfobulbaceae bacterium]|nr:hypothetical protein [Desulfobulbaceae bacterium]